MFIRTMMLTMILVIATQLSADALSQQAEQFGSYSIHYNTLNTNLLDPATASAYDIQRSGTRALLNIAVLRNDEDGDVAVTARVSATAVNLVGQRREIDMREIRDQDAIYYIGTFRFRQEETLNFRINVSPEGHTGAPHEFTFRQQFYTE
jgi:hypothetical protein